LPKRFSFNARAGSMAKKDSSKKSKKAKPETAPKSVGINVGGNVDKGNIVVGDNNVINNYITTVEKNIEKQEPDYWNLKHPYPMPPNFTGRLDERAMLTQWLDGDTENRLFILRALGGFGKSALAWHWLTHDVNPKAWTKVVFWSFYEGDASFENFTRETLEYLGIEVPQGGRPQVDEMLKAMQRDNILLILDGFERVLRLYASMSAVYQDNEELKIEDNQLDCVNINAEWFLKGICSNPKILGKVLITTRLTPRAIKPRGEIMLGCHEVELTSMQPADAVEFFHKQGIQGYRAEIEAACEPYGYHPLSLRLLAGRILKDFENPADIAVAQKLKIGGDIKAQQHHVLEVSYNSLSQHEQRLLDIISCFRSSIEIKPLVAITENLDSLNDNLRNLVDRGLLFFEGTNKKFDLHPIVRNYIYEIIEAPYCDFIHAILCTYYGNILEQERAENSDDYSPAIELYYHTVRAGKLNNAWSLFRDSIHNKIYYINSDYQQMIKLMRMLCIDQDDNIPDSINGAGQAWFFAALGNAYLQTGQSYRSISAYENVAVLLQNLHIDKSDYATVLGSLASVQLSIGALKSAEKNIHQRITISTKVPDKFYESGGYQELGRLLTYRGEWDEAKKHLSLSFRIDKSIKNYQGLSINRAYLGLYLLLMTREKPDLKKENFKIAIESLHLAIDAANEFEKETGGCL
jgi:tetratricopeptide (TPR) repeat protein